VAFSERAATITEANVPGPQLDFETVRSKHGSLLELRRPTGGKTS
jgi:hypothetical protein